MTTDVTPIIELRHASFGYADLPVVTGATLTVHPGEVVAVLGPNGSGKSTLVRGLLGLNDHLGGDVQLFGQPRESFSDFARLGYVPQRHTLSASVRATVTRDRRRSAGSPITAGGDRSSGRRRTP